MGQQFTIGQARAQAVLAFARGCEVQGIDFAEGQALVNEYQKHRGATQGAPRDYFDFESKVLSNLSPQARAVLGNFLSDPGMGFGNPTGFVSEGRARAQAVLGFARGCEINGIDRWAERPALRAEYNKHRDALFGQDLAEFKDVLRSNASGQAREAIFSWF